MGNEKKDRVQYYTGNIILTYFDCNNADERRDFMWACVKKSDFDGEKILEALQEKADKARTMWSKNLINEAVKDLKDCIKEENLEQRGK